VIPSKPGLRQNERVYATSRKEDEKDLEKRTRRISKEDEKANAIAPSSHPAGKLLILSFGGSRGLQPPEDA
jgi:hypothetical protein